MAVDLASSCLDAELTRCGVALVIWLGFTTICQSKDNKGQVLSDDL